MPDLSADAFAGHPQPFAGHGYTGTARAGTHAPEARDRPRALKGGILITLHGFYTNNGRALAAKVAAGTAELTITRVVAGSGHTEDIPSATDLPEQKQTLSVGLPTVKDATATVPVTLLEAEASADYDLTELGVYANDEAGEILFQIYRLDAAAAIRGGGEGVLRLYLRQSIGAEGVRVTCSPAGIVLEEDIALLRARDAFATHRNLLDNPFFTVNQRGQTSYTGNDGYTVDRWKSSGSVGTAAKDDHGITLQAETNNFCLKEPLEKLSAGSYTLSAYTRDFSGENIQFQISYKKNGTGHWDSYPIGHGDGLSQCTFAVTDDMTELSVGLKLNNGTVRIEAVKLELGSVSTLADDVAPNYQQELAKCQRYFQRFRTQSLRPTYADDFRPVMRTAPAMSTITVGGVTYYTATADL